MKELRKIFIKQVPYMKFDRKAYFHGFFNDTDNEIVAVCEMHDTGIVKTVSLDCIKFYEW